MPAPSMTTGDASGYLGGDTVKAVFDLAALEAFRAANVHRRFADVAWAGGQGAKPMPGISVTFTLINAMAPATTPLSETTEPTPVNISDTQKTVTLAEYGNAVKHTKKLRLTSFLNLDLEVPREVAANMEESLDLVARDVLAGGTQVLYAGNATSRTTVGTDDTLVGNNVRRARSKLVAANTPPPPGSQDYIAVIHPDVSYDLQIETGQAAWSAPHVYADPEALYSGELGRFAGVRFVENANAKMWEDASNGAGGSGTIDVYATIFVGRQALGEAVGEAQHMVISGPFDDLQRFISVGWYALLGYGRIREDSLLRYESASSIGANS